MNYLLDTNTISLLIKKNVSIERRLEEAVNRGDKIFTTVINHYEAKRGFFVVNATKKLRELEESLQTLGIIFLDDWAIFEEAIKIYAELKVKGNLIPDNDIFIAACAKTRNLTLVSDDTDFGRIRGLRVENWL